ncbi:MAG: DDE-type integrase/transposase/recombinase [Candidatus Paceibacterota bacterium]|jgi:transposase InsO family protein
MAIIMANTIKEERLRWVLPIAQGRIKLADAAKLCPYSQRSLERWLSAYRKHGEKSLEPKSTRPKSSPRETEIRVKERIIELRKEKRKCALKLKWELAKKGIAIHERTIGKIIKKEGLVRKYRTKKVKYKYVKAELKPGELVEIDVKYVPGRIAGRRFYQYTAIDCASRWRFLKIFEEQSSLGSILFLEEVLARFPFPIRAIKTDNGMIFTNWSTGDNKRSDRTIKRLHPLDKYCAERNIAHYLIDPGKPAQNGMVERSHRSDQERFYDSLDFAKLTEKKLKTRLKAWNEEYNDLEHCGLRGKTPNEALKQLLDPPNVCT